MHSRPFPILFHASARHFRIHSRANGRPRCAEGRIRPNDPEWGFPSSTVQFIRLRISWSWRVGKNNYEIHEGKLQASFLNQKLKIWIIYHSKIWPLMARGWPWQGGWASLAHPNQPRNAFQNTRTHTYTHFCKVENTNKNIENTAK